MKFLTATNKRMLRTLTLGMMFGVFSSNSFAVATVNNDVYSIDEDSILTVAAPGILQNDIGDATLVIDQVEFVSGFIPGNPGKVPLSGTTYTLYADGSLVYNAVGRFDYLAVGQSVLDKAFGSSTYSFRYTAADLAGRTGIANIMVTITGVNDTPTALTIDSTTVGENLGINELVGNFSSTDVDISDTHTYTLVAGAGDTDNAVFDVIGTKLVARNTLDSDVQASFSIRVQTDDGNGGTLQQTFIINILDQNDNAPVFTSASTISINENETAILTVTTTDVDTVGTGPAYSISGGLDSGAFSVDSGSGVLTFNSGPDFETPTDSNTDNDYIVEVSANDGVNTSNQTITVTVLNLSDTSPSGSGSSTTINEDGSYTFSATDFNTSFADADGDTFAQILINTVPGSGTLKLSGATVINGSAIPAANIPNLVFLPATHEAGTPYGVLNFSVQDSSGATSVTAYTFTINVTDVADAPTLSVVSPATGNEDSNIGLNITAVLVDADGSETLSTIITGYPTGITFTKGSDLGGGAWSFIGSQLSGLQLVPLTNSNDNFTLTVTSTARETNGGGTAQTATALDIAIAAVNDNPIVANQSFSINENSPNNAIIGTVVASDIEPVGTEAAQSLSYSIDGTAFKIDTSGIIRVNDSAQLDFESTPLFTPTVTVTDDGAPNKSSTATISINLNGLNDNAPVAVDDAVNVDELQTLVFNPINNDTDADLPAPTLTVIEVAGDIGLVGVPFDLEIPPVLPAVTPTVVGTLTINVDGSSTFVTNPDITIEEYFVSTTYKINDGTTDSNEAVINITINPINDNQPALTAVGLILQTIGVEFDEDEVPNAGSANVSNGAFVLLNELFSDIDIDDDGIFDSNTGDDQDALVFSIISNSNASVVQTDLQGGDLFLFSGANEHGTATIKIGAQDQATPLANKTTAELDLVVTVNSVNDAPIYSLSFYSDIPGKQEDSGDIVVDLANAFSDADLQDANGSDDQLTYELTITDTPNEFVLTTIIDETALSACANPLPDPVVTCIFSDDTPADQPRTLVIVTQDSSINLVINNNAHGTVDVSVKASDLGLPVVGSGAPLFAVGPPVTPFRVTINALGDDTPAAVDDHYNDFPALVIDEDSGTLIFDVIQNDDQGDAPAEVISIGTTIVDKTGISRRWRSTSRLADPDDTGDLAIEINGEVSCAFTDCITGQTADTLVDGTLISPFEVAYNPRQDFNGEDSFTYCIRDSAPAGEATFTPPTDVRCATVTVNVLPVNDAPVIDDLIVITMDQADDLIMTAENGLRNFVRDVDNTHQDGLGCDPRLIACTPVPTDPQPDRLYFYFDSALTNQGQLFAPFTDDGAFNYRPNATFAGSDEFGFQVCDTPTPGDVDHCDSGTVAIQIQPLAGAPEGSTDGAVQFDYRLANTPLELPIGPEPNVLIVNDDSGSMHWDIMANGASGLYQLASGNYLYYVNKATAGFSTYVAPDEATAPNQGLWRLRNSAFNTVYYNPAIRYKPWEGLDTSDAEFPDSPPTAARHNPLSSSPTTNLTIAIDYTGRAVDSSPRTCNSFCVRYRKGRCRSYRTFCSGGNRFTTIAVNNFYIPRYYKWNDKDGDGNLDATPSPALDPTNSEGELVLILDDGTQYDREEERTDCVTSELYCTYNEELQNFANWFTYSRNREYTAKAALGVVVANAENIRVGYGKLNSNSNLRPIESMNTSERTGAKAALLDAIYATNSSGGTPLRRSLRDAGRYFECKRYDIFNSNSNSSPGSAGCPVLPAPDGNCQQNFTLLLTDGTWNGYSPFTGNSDGDNNTSFDGGAFASSSFTTLADVAMLYYERDLHTSLNNEVPTTSRDRAMAADTAFEGGGNEITFQHMTTYTVGFGVSGLVDAMPVDYTQGFNWGSPFSSTQRKTDDVRHAAYNGRGEYLDAANGSDLAKKLVEAFEEFSQGSGAASAVSFNSQEIQEDTLIFRAFYNTKINTGDLIAQRLTENGLTEEPVWRSAEIMDLTAATDREIITYDAVNSVGIAFRPNDLNTPQRNSFISDLGATTAQQNAEVTQRVNYLRGDSANERPVGNFRERPTIEGRLGDIVHSTPVFVGPPNRSGRDAVPYPQGDGNLYSAFVSAKSAREAVIFVEANDGMLHGFDAIDGHEVFGFIPNNLMLGTFSRKITELLDFEYIHKFFNDLTPAINDVYIDVDGDDVGATDVKEWATVVIGGQGAGAKGYYALNATDPTKFTEATAGEVVLWEFTEEDDSYPTDASHNPLLNGLGGLREDLQDTPKPVKDLGYSFSVPTLAMSNLVDSKGNQEWIAVFGNGYNSTAGIAKLFVLRIDKGIDGTWCHPDMGNNVVLGGAIPTECVGKQDFIKIDTGFGVSGGFPNGLGTPRGIDVDGNGTIDYAYAGDTFGNFFRFDLTSSNFNEWSVTKIFEAKYVDDLNNEFPQPITTQPIVTLHPTEPDGFIVIFGTGSYITVPDGADKNIQSIYGIWDRLSPELLDINDMVQQRYTNKFDATFGSVRVLTTNPVDYSVVGGKKGWYNHLDTVALNGNQASDPPEFPGEKAIRNIQIRGGLAFVNSIIPRSDTSCVDVAGGFALSFCPGTGSVDCLANRGIFDLDNDGAFDEGDEVDNQIVAGIRFEDAVPTDSSFIDDQRITQLSDKSLDSTTTNTSGGSNTGRLSWKQLDTVD